MASKYDVYIPTIKMLYKQNATDKEISKCIGIDSRRISEIRKRIGLKAIRKSEIPLRPNEIEEQLLIGGLVGDMCIFKRSEEHTSELQSRFDLVCRLLLEKKNK